MTAEAYRGALEVVDVWVVASPRVKILGADLLLEVLYSRSYEVGLRGHMVGRLLYVGEVCSQGCRWW